MGDKMITMDSTYRKKHYPKGFFAAMAKQTRGNGIAVIICGVVLAAMGLGVLWLAIAMTSGEYYNPSEDLSVTIVISVIGLIIFIPGVLLVWLGVKRCKSGESGWIEKSMKASGYPESTIRDFADQALEDGTLKMDLGSSHTQGFLTRDYIFFQNIINPCIIKIEDIVGAYMVDVAYSVNAGGARINVNNINIRLISDHKTTTGSDAKKESIRQIFDMLTKKNPSIDTAGGNLISEAEYDKKVKELTNGLGVVAD